ncbi:MAG: ABC transporter permease, partial [Muribaculaceae bacterium]|nr:ABC transporter permease [Muribaculaceae bacterium]
MNVLTKITRWAAGLGRVFRNELRLIVRDPGVLLFFVALPLAYPIVYTLIYNPEVVRKLPVAVVDNSCTADSRNFVRMAEASPSIEIYAYCPNMADAKELMAEGKVFGIMQIPGNYAKCIGRGEQAHVEFYADMSLLLRFRTFVSALTDLQLEIISDITGERISQAGLESLAAGGSLPVKSESNFLGDTEQGFASFVIPGIVILILQQSMILGITMLGGTSRERRRRNGGIDPKEVAGVGATATIFGKALCYTVFYFPLTIYIMRYIPEIFNLPHYGSAVDYLLFIFPMLLSTAFLGLTLNIAMRERESAFIIIVFT